jgi:hypothetical protein
MGTVNVAVDIGSFSTIDARCDTNIRNGEKTVFYCIRDAIAASADPLSTDLMQMRDALTA